MTSHREDSTGILTRSEARKLFSELQTRAQRSARRRRSIRWTAGMGLLAIGLAAVLILRAFLIAPPSALAFSRCQRVDPTGGGRTLLDLLERSPGIALIDRAGAASVRPVSVTLRCAVKDGTLIAVRVSSVLGRFGRVSVETWFKPTPVQTTHPVTAVEVDDRQTRASLLQGGEGIAVSAAGYPGIPLVIIRGIDARSLPSHFIKLGVATRTTPDLASIYDVALATPSGITVHPTSSPTSWSFEVASQDELIAKLGALGLSNIAVLPDSQPRQVDVFQGQEGLVVKTTYPDAGAGGVRVVQSENAATRPVGGQVVEVRGVAGVEVGGVLYWTENGYALGLDADSTDASQYAESLQWVTP